MIICLASCSINFELTSQRTALENQMLGEHQELDDELYMISSVRGLEKESQDPDRKNLAQQNQLFNQDDLEELKEKQIIGEKQNGTISLVPKAVTSVSTSKKENILAKILIKEENHDRMVIWKSTIKIKPELTIQDLPKLRKNYNDQIYKSSKPGLWFEINGRWKQKPEDIIKVDGNEKNK